MTKQALIELRDKVAANAEKYVVVNQAIDALEGGFPRLEFSAILANFQKAYFDDSLDAAVAFLEAVLPGSDWVVRTCDPNEPDAAYAHTWLGDHPSISGVHHEYWAATPARALLLATLGVLIERAE